MIDARQFRIAAEQRFTVAEFLLEADFTLDAFYLAGYSVECILKALIMHITPAADQLSNFSAIEEWREVPLPGKVGRGTQESGDLVSFGVD